jgi:SAM-dependent methyltransferase
MYNELLGALKIHVRDTPIGRLYRGIRLRPMKHLVWFGSFRRLRPISRMFGFDRGSPIDRYYIESFLEKSQGDIRGVVMEIGDNHYTIMFGGNKVVKSEVLHAVTGNPQATLVGDLASGNGIPFEAFDCIILTQTVHLIFEKEDALRNCYRALKPGGTLLVTLPGISQISRYDMDRWGDYWRFTSLSAKKLFDRVFPPENVEVASFGNVLVAVSFLHGLAADELRKKQLDYNDPDYQVLITVRAKKPL